MIYDITTGDSFPKDFPHIYNGRVIRCVYNQDGIISMLTGTHKHDGVHLNLYATPGYSAYTSSNSIHHHISKLSEIPHEYAKYFNTKKFIIEYLRGDVDFILKRFPKWVFVGFTETDASRFELDIS